MVNQRLTNKFIPKTITPKLANIASMGGEPMILPNNSGVKKYVADRNLYVKIIGDTMTGGLTVNGDVLITNNSTETLRVENESHQATFIVDASSGNIQTKTIAPMAHNTYNIGLNPATDAFRDGYFTGTVYVSGDGNSGNWKTAYDHSQDNSQAHTDYLINNGDDITTGSLTLSVNGKKITIPYDASNNATYGSGACVTVPSIAATDVAVFNISTATTTGLFYGFGDSTIKLMRGGSMIFEFDVADEPYFESIKFKISNLGGYCIKLTNRTGSNTIAGQLVKADTANNDAAILTASQDTECIGVFLDGGVADRAEAFVVIAGIADVYFQDNHGPTRGDWVATATLAETGSAVSQATPAAAPTHFREIGHCIETVAAGGAGTHVNARCVLHFN